MLLWHCKLIFHRRFHYRCLRFVCWLCDHTFIKHYPRQLQYISILDLNTIKLRRNACHPSLIRLLTSARRIPSHASVNLGVDIDLLAVVESYQNVTYPLSESLQNISLATRKIVRVYYLMPVLYLIFDLWRSRCVNVKLCKLFERLVMLFPQSRVLLGQGYWRVYSSGSELAMMKFLRPRLRFRQIMWALLTQPWDKWQPPEILVPCEGEFGKQAQRQMGRRRQNHQTRAYF